MYKIIRWALPMIMVGNISAASSCADRDTVVGRLSQMYKESRFMGGLDQNNRLVEIWASSETGTWTIVVTNPNGMSCILSAGGNFQNFFAVKGEVI